MKKVLIFILILLLLAGGSYFAWQRDRLYRELNACFESEATRVALCVSVGEGDDALTGEYTLDRSGNSEVLEYRYEQLCAFEMKNGQYVAPATRKETVEGSARISGGKLILLEGRQVNIPLDDLTLSRVQFVRSHFADVVSEEGLFEASVADPAGFAGVEEACEEMRVSMCYSEGRVDELVLSYRNGDGAPVVMTYRFTY